MVWIKLFLISAILGTVYSLATTDLDYSVANELGNYISNVLPQLNKLSNLLQKWSEAKTPESECNACNKTAKLVIDYRRGGASAENMKALLHLICTNLIKYEAKTCTGFVNIHVDTYLYILDNTADLTSERICRLYLPRNKCHDPNARNWTINIPARKKWSNIHKSSNSGTFKVMHLTDIHYDPDYLPGSSSECIEPLCCERDSTPSPNSTATAGFWGDYNFCDMPQHSVVNLFQQIKEQHSDIDFVYFTGDIISHRMWTTSIASNTDIMKFIFDQMKSTFGTKKVYPVLGNHESHPVDLWTPDGLQNTSISTQWLLNFVAKEWSSWLPQEALNTVQKGGYYTVLVKDGFRVVVINSNVCFSANIWLVYDEVDPYNQLQWLVDVLQQAEENREFVHIVAHVPPGDPNSYDQCLHQFHRIIDRYAHIISGQFNGHSHQDQFKVFYNMSNPKQVINLAFNGASFTTFVGNNPNYRIYDISNANYQVVNFDEWIFNMTEANLSPGKAPRWYKLYSFKEAYEMTDLSYDRFHNLLQRMASNMTLLEQYRRFYVRDSDVLLKQKCNGTCLMDYLCEIVTVEQPYTVQCDDMRATFLKNQINAVQLNMYVYQHTIL